MAAVYTDEVDSYPVEVPVARPAGAFHQADKQTAQVRVVGRLGERQVPRVPQQRAEFVYSRRAH